MDLTELILGFKKVGLKLSDTQMEKLMIDCDKDNSGEVTLQEVS